MSVTPRWIVLALFLVVACDGSTEPQPVPDLLELSLSALSFDAVGDSETVSVQVIDQFGEPLEGASLTWDSDDPGVAAVQAGTVHSTGAGATTIRVSADDASASIPVQVTPTPVAAEAVGTLPTAAPAGSLVNGQGVRILDRNGHPIPGVVVQLAATAGTVQATSVSTGTDGRANFGWTVAEVAGETSVLTATPTGLDPLHFEVQVVHADPDAFVVEGDGQVGHRGMALAAPISLRLVDAFGNPVPDTPIEVDTDHGSVTPTLTETDAAGEASFTWTLGETLGAAEATLRVGDVETTVTAEAVATPDQIVVVSGSDQSAHRTLALDDPVRFRVLDEIGEPIPGVTVTLDAGSGTLSATTASTDSSGEVSVEWTLGETLGTVHLEATAGGLSALASAEAFATPDALEIVAGDGQSGPALQPLPEAPAVRLLDAVGLALPGRTVTFTVGDGGGALSGSATTQRTTGSGGIATAPPWTLGPDSEAQTLVASSSGVGSVTFDATADLSAPASLVVIGGTGQSGEPGETLGTPIEVKLTDLAGDPVPGASVSWSGDGSVGSASSETDADGRAQATWTVGSSTGTQTLVIATGGLQTTVTAEVTAAPPPPPPPPSGFHIEYEYQTPMDPDVQAVFEAAAARWAEVIVGKLPEVHVDIDTGQCGSTTPIDRTVDDLLIIVQVEYIDGPGGILGSAGPCLVRGGSILPALGRVRLDEADVNQMLQNGTLYDVVLHEIGHVLGIGTLWSAMGLLQDPAPESDPDLDPYFSGPEAIAGFDAVGGTTYTDGEKVPVENTGGNGTRNGHWRQSVLSNELMTGWLSGGSNNPLSLITVGSLADMGYTVDSGAADAFSFSAAIITEGDPIHLHDDIDPFPIIVVDSRGEVLRTLPPPEAHH